MARAVLPGERAWTLEPGSPGMSLPGEILNFTQPLAGNLWLDSSVSTEPEPMSLWFPGSQPLCTRRKPSSLFWLFQHVLHLGFIEDFTELETQLPAPL